MSEAAVEAVAVRGTMWIVSAPSGAGKTSLTRAAVGRLRERGIEAAISVSYTTRAPRPGEVDGADYHFIDDERFARMVEQGAFLEYAAVFGHHYGTGRTETERLLAVGTHLFLDIDWQGARQLRAHCRSARGVFVLPPSRAELEQRLRARRQDSEAVIAQRMRQAREEIAHHTEYDYLIVNDDFERALSELIALVLAVRVRTEEQRRRHADLIAELLA